MVVIRRTGASAKGFGMLDADEQEDDGDVDGEIYPACLPYVCLPLLVRLVAFDCCSCWPYKMGNKGSAIVDCLLPSSGFAGWFVGFRRDLPFGGFGGQGPSRLLGSLAGYSLLPLKGWSLLLVWCGPYVDNLFSVGALDPIFALEWGVYVGSERLLFSSEAFEGF
ncbi:hypothetical protein SUGI_0243620 [Cryptomeria japonica]|nr:hypothetical protein SUGI_0243620 [Cryptomeria japonica]